MLKHLLKAVLGSLFSGKRRPAAATFIQQALAAQQAGDLKTAESVLRAGIAAYASAHSLHVLLAELLRKRGRATEARAEYERAQALKPQPPEVCFNYAVALEQTGDFAAARRAYHDVIASRPDWAEAHLNCGFVSCKTGEYAGALALFERALALAPVLAQAHTGAGSALMSLDRPSEAIGHFHDALDIDPQNGGAFEYLCAVQYKLGDDAGLRATLTERQRAARSGDGAAIVRALALPSVLDSRQQIGQVRTCLNTELDELGCRRLAINDPALDVGVTSFNLAYQGEDDRAIHERIAALHLQACPGLAFVAPHCAEPRARGREPIRVGIASTFLHDHSIGRVVRGLFARLDRRRVSVHGFAFGVHDDLLYRAMKNDADTWTTLPRELATARERLANARLDVLLYPDIGMDPLTYFLAFARLAPVQCTTWGHPVTSGVPALDYYISTDYFESPGSADHYSEQLVQLEDVAFPGYYARPPAIVAAPAPGFDRGRRVYFCPQMLFKFHPDFDAILADILRRDPGGEIVIAHNGAYDAHRLRRLQARLQGNAGDVYDRIAFLPRTPTADGYLQRLRAADVILDTIHYCGGNTSLEAISAGALVVTMPSALQRGRHTYGFFRKMRCMDTVVQSAEEYARLAVRIASDKAFSDHLKAAQRARVAALYEDDSSVRQMEDFFERALGAAGAA